MAALQTLPSIKPKAPASRTTAEDIYRPFFLSGIAIVLTLGAVWGAYLLLRIAAEGRFAAAGLHEVNAHGHAQIFGWVGLFVMGFAYQAFPRFLGTKLRFPALAWTSFGLMLAGILGRSLLEPMAKGNDLLIGLAIGAGALEVVAIAMFVFNLGATWRASGQPLLVGDCYIAAALCWFLVQAIYDAVYFAATLLAAPDDLVPLVAAWQGALRDLQIHGFAAMMILGVSRRLLPGAYGFRRPSRRLAIACLIGLNAGLIAEAAGIILMRLDSRAWAGLWYAGVIVYAASAATLVTSWRLFGRSEKSDRSLKFVRAAYTWLFISLAMLIALPVYQFAILPAISPDSAAAKMGFSHAYYGATRHAITVGFVSLMIVGIGAKVAAAHRGYLPRELTSLWVPFVLINAGCALRVVGQTATARSRWLFPIAGVSGVLAVTGLAVWGLHMAGMMLRPSRWPEERGSCAARSLA
jgi:hypothetical protein